MKKHSLLEALKKRGPLVSDGAWGTLLQARGLKPGECPEQWTIDRADDVRHIAARYLEAGADMVKTNSFGGTRFKLQHFGLADRARAINAAAARLSAEAVAACGREAWVIASMGPTGKMLLLGDVTEQELYDAFREQAEALAEGGADALCIETMSDIEEAALAVRAAREHTACEVLVTFTFERTVNGDYRTIMGVTPEQAAEAMLDAGAHAIGTNCGNGLERMVDVVARMRAAAPNAPIVVHANAGLPAMANGVDVFPDTPERMAALVPHVVEAGATIVGGCCGTTPGHISAMAQALGAMRGARDAQESCTA